MLRRKMFLIFVGLFFALFFNLQTTLAYDSHVAHPNIAVLATKSYNFGNDHDITDKQLQYIMQGAQEEDVPVRWLNHFYDPIYNVGFSDFIVTDKIQPYKMAQDWLQSPYKQATFADGDRSWQRGLDDYARGEEESAFRELGHAIHLISDISVPGHTRNSLHVGDSYESFVKNNWSSIKPKLVYGFTEVNSLKQAFNELAVYSNNNFYSDRTIESEKYNVIDVEIDNTIKTKDYLYGVYRNKENKNLVYIDKVQNKWKENSLFRENLVDPLNTGIILTDYSKNLIPKAISYSAGLIKLFITEAEAKKAEMEYEKMSWWEQIKSFFINPDLPYYRKAVEGYAMEKTLTPLIENGEIALEKIAEIKKEIEKLAKTNEETKEPEKIIPEVKAGEEKEVESYKEQVTSTIEEIINTTTTEEAVSTTLITSTTTTITTDTPIYYSSGGGGGSSSNNNKEDKDDEIPTSTPDIEIFAPELFLELLQTSTTLQITLSFSSTETTSLPINFEGEINTGTLWSPLFPWTSSTSYIYETNNSGDYEFRVRVIDSAFNTSTWTQIATTVPMMDYVYNYLTGEQTETTTILTKEGSPYIIDKYYYVGVGQTLQIEAGVTIKGIYSDTITEKGLLDIAGNLVVEGTLEEKVIFTSAYDHSFGNDKLDTLNFEGILKEGAWGGIRSFSGANLKMNNFEIRYAGEEFSDYDVKLAWIISYHNRCLDLSNSVIEINNGNINKCGYFSAVNLDNCTGSFNNSSLESNRVGLEIDGGSVLFSNLIFNGFNEAPIKIFSGEVTYDNLVFENNRLNGILDYRLTGAVEVGESDVPYIFDSEGLSKITSLSAQPGAEIYFDGNNEINGPVNFVGTEDKKIKIYLTEVYAGGLKINGGENSIKYVDFINTSPFLESLAKDYYGVNTPWEFVQVPENRSELFSYDRGIALEINNGSLNLENVNFINDLVPWKISLLLTNNTTTLKNVNFYNNKSNGDLSYLSETDARGIEVYSGTLSMDNVNFSDLVTGVFYSADSGFDSPTIITNNMSAGSFVNVTNISLPEGLLSL